MTVLISTTNEGSLKEHVTDIKSDEHFNSLVKNASGSLLVVSFWASWAEPCKQIDEVVKTLASDHPGALFLRVEAEEYPEISESLGVTCVPFVAFVKNGKELARVEGANAPLIVAKVEEFDKQTPSENKVASKEAPLSTRERIDKILASAPVMLFMKGSPGNERCGFSRKIVEIMKKHNVVYSTFDILEDEDVRQELKKYKDFPTYPQLYLNGSLLGGLDIIKEMDEEGEFADAIQAAVRVPEKEDINVRLEKLVNRHKVMLFMKGDPANPRCGFSSKIVDILHGVKANYDHFDILSDQEVRSGLKEYANWPTFPQLWVDGKLVGGLDIIKELAEEDELKDALAGN